MTNTYKVTITIEVPDIATHAPEDAIEFVKDMVKEVLSEHEPIFTDATAILNRTGKDDNQ
jgi:hypothetical protein